MLIEDAVPLDVDSDHYHHHPSALALALDHGDFDLATLLTSAGAANTINQPYAWPDHRDGSISLVGKASQVTDTSLRSGDALHSRPAQVRYVYLAG